VKKSSGVGKANEVAIRQTSRVKLRQQNARKKASTSEGYTVKPTLAENSPSTADTPPKTTAAPPTYVTVYTFVVWDHDKGATALYPRMATREAVAKMRGKVNEDTAWVVDASALDVEGFYSGSRRDVR
jgi:hypothetical protein